jgi:outer membrane protein assembly factor BamB
MRRRAALSAVAGVVGSLAGCAAVHGDDPPIETDWHVGPDAPTSVAATESGRLLAGWGPFRDEPIVAELDQATGERRWGVTVGKGERSPVAVAGERAYAFSKAETLVAVDAVAGEPVWQRPLAPVDEADPGVVEFAPVPLGDRLVVPVSGTEDDVPDRLVGVVRDDGEPLFTHRFAASLSGAPGAAADGLVVPLVDGRVAFIDRTGTRRWTRDVGGAASAVGVAGGTAYLGAATEALLALDTATGEDRWTEPLANTGFARPLVTDDWVFVGDAAYALRALDRETGEEIWRDELANAVTHGPFAVGDRLVTLVGGDHRVRGPSGTVPFTPTALYVHGRDGSRVRAVRFDGSSLDGGSVEWLAVAGETAYLGQTFGLTRLAPEAVRDA